MQYERIGDRLVILAAAGDAPAPPGWWWNLETDSHVVVSIGGVAREKRRRRALESGRLCGTLARRTPALPGVQQRAGRELPVVVLDS